MHNIVYFKVFFALLFVICLALLSIFLLNRLGIGHRTSIKRKDKKLIIIDSLMIDPSRRMILVRLYDKEYLLLTNKTQDIVIDQHIKVSESIKNENNY